MAGGQRGRDPPRAPARAAVVALGRRPGRLARRRVRDHGRRPRRDRARPVATYQRDGRGGVHRPRGAVGDAHLRDADPVHRPRGCGCIPDAALQHRGRGSALPRRDRRFVDRAPARRPWRDLDAALRRRDVRRGGRPRRALGADPGRAAGVREDERDHHVADAQLRRRAAAHVPDLRQRSYWRDMSTLQARVVPAGEADARRVEVADVRLVASSSRSASSSASSPPSRSGSCTRARASASR